MKIDRDAFVAGFSDVFRIFMVGMLIGVGLPASVKALFWMFAR